MVIRLSSRYKKSLKTNNINKCCWSSKVFSGISAWKKIYIIIQLFNLTIIFLPSTHCTTWAFIPKFASNEAIFLLPGYHSSSALWPMTRVPTSKFGGSAMKLKEKNAVRQGSFHNLCTSCWNFAQVTLRVLKELTQCTDLPTSPHLCSLFKILQSFSHSGSL